MQSSADTSYGTAQPLLALKRSVYRPQADGVPSPIVARFLNNTTPAAGSLKQIASKLDAPGQQGVNYILVAPRRVQEEYRLAQLQAAAHTAQETIALLIVSGIQRDRLAQVDDDLSALPQAVKQLHPNSAPDSVPARIFGSRSPEAIAAHEQLQLPLNSETAYEESYAASFHCSMQDVKYSVHTV